MRNNNGRGATPKLPKRRWAGMTHLQTVRRLNQGCVALLARRKREEADLSAGETDLDWGGWSKVDSRVLGRAAACPILLLDLNFQRADWWEQAVRGSIPPRPIGRSAWFSREEAKSLVQEILTEAWSIGRTMPRAANLVFGMAPAVTAAIAGLGAAEIDRIAVECIPYLRPRWFDRPTFWVNLLRAARGADDTALANVHLHMLQLLGGELLFRPA